MARDVIDLKDVAATLANPYARFKAFGSAARAFQQTHRSERLRTMTLVAPAAKFLAVRPVCLSLDGVDVKVKSWEEVFAQAASRLVAAHPARFNALQAANELVWLGCAAADSPIGEILSSGGLNPAFASLEEVIGRVQWLFLVCGIGLDEVIVQVDPYTDEEWRVRRDQIRERRAADKAFLEGRRAGFL